MTQLHSNHTDVLMDRFGYKVAGALSSVADELPHDISERLRASRVRALAQRKPAPQLRTVPVVLHNGHSAALGWTGGFWENMASFVPVVIFLMGLITMDAIQQRLDAREIAAVDAALLTDDLPPAAYADPGFAQFLKHHH